MTSTSFKEDSLKLIDALALALADRGFVWPDELRKQYEDVTCRLGCTPPPDDRRCWEDAARHWEKQGGA